MSLYGRLWAYLLIALMPFMFTACPAKKEDNFLLWLFGLAALAQNNAGPNYNPACVDGAGTKQITVTWTASRSFDANSAAGGGHKIYYSYAPGVTKTTATLVDVPNTTSATSGTITGLYSGCPYFIKVGAYSALNPTGGNLSTESSITVP